METKEYTFKLNEQEANYILNLLAKKPFYQVQNLIQKMQKQAIEQTVPAEPIEPIDK